MSQESHRAAAYFGLVFILTLPFWILGAAFDVRFLPGLPISALAVMVPTLAAGLLSFWDGGGQALISLLARALDFSRAGWRLLVIALVNPALFGLAFLAARFSDGNIPNASFDTVEALLLFALFLPCALLEELGWSGYALDRLQTRSSPLAAAFILGVIWAIWHYPALTQVGRSIEWIAWWSVWTVSARTIMVWLYNWAGASVFAVALYHAISNLCWQLFPIHGSYFDARTSGVITLVLAVMLMIWPSQKPAVREAK
jgi:membrane protease YdiL (CAAX protease family)